MLTFQHNPTNFLGAENITCTSYRKVAFLNLCAVVCMYGNTTTGFLFSFFLSIYRECLSPSGSMLPLPPRPHFDLVCHLCEPCSAVFFIHYVPISSYTSSSNSLHLQRNRIPSVNVPWHSTDTYTQHIMQGGWCKNLLLACHVCCILILTSRCLPGVQRDAETNHTRWGLLFFVCCRQKTTFQRGPLPKIKHITYISLGQLPKKILHVTFFFNCQHFFRPTRK